jgi:hypothetical protein
MNSTRIKYLENEIKKYHNYSGIIFMLSIITMDKTLIRHLYTELAIEKANI